MITGKNEIICPYCENGHQPTNYIHYACSSGPEIEFTETCLKCNKKYMVSRKIIKEYTTRRDNDVLIGKELRIAVDNGLKVRYVVESDQEKYACDEVLVFTREDIGTDFESSVCYSENDRCVDLNDFPDNGYCVIGIFGEGKIFFKKVEGVNYSERES
jgi:hypothetical protein